MKRAVLPLFAIVTLSFAVAPAQACSCGKAEEHKPTKKAPHDAATIVMSVSGMSCGGCATKISSELKGIEGVYDATVEFKTQRATVKYAAKKVTVSKLLKTIRDLGYKVAVVKRG